MKCILFKNHDCKNKFYLILWNILIIVNTYGLKKFATVPTAPPTSPCEASPNAYYPLIIASVGLYVIYPNALVAAPFMLSNHPLLLRLFNLIWWMC